MRLGVVGDAEPGLQVVAPHAVHVDRARPQVGEVGHLGGRQRLEQAFRDGGDHDRIVHHDDREILLVLVLLHLLEVDQRARCPRRRPCSLEFLLDRRGDHAVHRRSSCGWRRRRPRAPCPGRAGCAGKPPSASGGSRGGQQARREKVDESHFVMAVGSPCAVFPYPRRRAIGVPMIPILDLSQDDRNPCGDARRCFSRHRLRVHHEPQRVVGDHSLTLCSGRCFLRSAGRNQASGRAAAGPTRIVATSATAKDAGAPAAANRHRPTYKEIFSIGPFDLPDDTYHTRSGRPIPPSRRIFGPSNRRRCKQAMRAYWQAITVARAACSQHQAVALGLPG